MLIKGGFKLKSCMIILMLFIAGCAGNPPPDDGDAYRKFPDATIAEKENDDFDPIYFNIFFKNDQFDEIEPAGWTDLTVACTEIRKRPNSCIRILGYAPLGKKPQESIELSSRRAEWIKRNILEIEHIDPTYIRSVMGTNPVDISQATESEKRLANRVEIIVYPCVSGRQDLPQYEVDPQNPFLYKKL